MRDGDWKVLAKLDIEKAGNVTTKNEATVKAAVLSDIQIFKITDDVSESKDLSSTMSEKLAELTVRLKKHYAQLLEGSHIWEQKPKPSAN